MSNSGSDPRSPLERHKVKITHAERARRERERGRLDVRAGVQGAVHVDGRATSAATATAAATTAAGTSATAVPSGNGEVFWVSGAPAETARALGERGAAQRRLAALQFG